MAKAAKAEGVERAKFLDEALSALDPQIVEVYYTDVINEIVELDAKDTAGLRSKYNEAHERELQRELLSDIAMVARLRSPETAIQFIDEAVQNVPLAPATKYRVLLTKLDLLRKIGEAEKAASLVDEMMHIDGLDNVDVQKLIAKKAFLMFGDGRKDDAYALLDQRVAEMASHAHLLRAKAELQAADGHHAEAIKTADQAIDVSRDDPNLTLELVEIKADSQVAAGDDSGAIDSLDAFSAQAQWPAVLRAETLLQKAMILRETARRRAAIISENKAVELCESPSDKAEVQRLVDLLRKRYEPN